MKNQRLHFRICYPASNRATFVVGFKKYSLHDLSESGAMLIFTFGGNPFKSKKTLRGKVKMLTGPEFNVSGDVVRSESDRLALKFSKKISLKAMYDEHRYVVSRYGELES